MDRTGIWDAMFHSLYNGNNAVGLAGSAISALDIALWDLAGNASGLPVHALFGGRVRDKVCVYATGLYYTEDEMATGRLLAEAKGYADQGFLGMKTKVGGLSVDEDVKRVMAIRHAIGPDIKLMIDANEAYNARMAVQIAQKLEAANADITWFEEPVNAQDRVAYTEIRAALPGLAIAGGENLRTRYEFSPYLTERAYDIVQPDIMHCGGLTEMARISAMANSCGVQVCPHVWGSAIMIAATLHLTATLPPCPPARNALPFGQEPVMEFDRTESPIRQELCTTTFEQEGGYVRVPSGTGLGVVVDEAVLARLTVDPLQLAAAAGKRSIVFT
jgi:D-galactarolactone cycloisomerase